MNGTSPHELPEDPELAALEWWAKCNLRTTTSEPRVHVLTLPDGKSLELSTVQMLNPTMIRARMLDQVGVLPPLPSKGAAAFLRVVFAEIFSRREKVDAPEEASEEGTLRGDVEAVLRGAPRSDDPRDIERGAFVLIDGDMMFSARMVYERVRRVCPVKVTPQALYAALIAVGCSTRGKVRSKGWRGRAWAAPAQLFALDTDGQLALEE